MAKNAKLMDTDSLVVSARRDAQALGRLYEFYYQRVYRFCLYRLFCKEAAEDTTSIVFLTVARQIRTFQGRTEQDFANWLYTIAVNHANSYIRKSSRRQRLMDEAAASIARIQASADDPPQPDWPTLYSAVSKLKPKHQTIITLRFFENMEFEQIATIVKSKPSTVRVMLHRALRQLKDRLQAVLDGGA